MGGRDDEVQRGGGRREGRKRVGEGGGWVEGIEREGGERG